MTLDEFKNGIDWLMSNPDGCVNFKVGKTPEGRDVAIVLGFVDGYDEDADEYQIILNEKLLTMCGKVAVNIDDLQFDYDFDWYMPWFKDGAHDRVFTAMLQKTLSLTDDSKYLREEFTDGKELVFFSLEERGKLADRVRSLLAHQEDVMEIAENGYRKAVLQHTWKQRTAVLVKELKVL